MLVKGITTEFGFTADKWIITQAPMTRINDTDIDIKIVIECYLSKDDFVAKRTSLGRRVLHKIVNTPPTLEQMYNMFKEPILQEVVQEPLVKNEGETDEGYKERVDSRERIFEDINFFKDAENLFIVPWHNEDKSVQVIMTDNQNTQLMQSNYGLDLLGYFKGINPITYNEKGKIYIYLKEIYPIHQKLLEKFGIVINKK